MKYFYTWWLAFIIPFTIFFYIIAKPAERKKMIGYGFVFGAFAVIFDYVCTLDYFTPNYLISWFHFEDFLYGFAFAGILPSVHLILRGKDVTKNMNNNKFLGGKKGNIKVVALYVAIVLATFYITVILLNMNTIYWLCFSSLIIGIYDCTKVKGDIKDVLITIFVALLITLTAYNLMLEVYLDAFKNHWLLNNLSGVNIFRVPIEEWMFAICLAIGCTYNCEVALIKPKRNKNINEAEYSKV